MMGRRWNFDQIMTIHQVSNSPIFGAKNTCLWSTRSYRMDRLRHQKLMRASQNFHRSSHSRWNARSYDCSCFLVMKVDGLVSITCLSLSELRYGRIKIVLVDRECIGATSFRVDA